MKMITTCSKSAHKADLGEKLFYGHLMKMITTCSKSAHKADLGAVLALSKISLSPGATSLSDRIWELHISSSKPIWSLL